MAPTTPWTPLRSRSSWLPTWPSRPRCPAKPVLMEPIGELKVTIPDSYLGDVMGDLNKRRGRVMGMNPTGDGEQVLEAEVPMAEMMSYAIDLRSMTQSRGTFTFNFVRYEDCPAAAQEKAIAEAKALAEAE